MTPETTRSSSAGEQFQRTHQRLLAATRALLEDGAFETLTMEKVAARADVTRRTVYLHFASRCDLVAQLFDYVARTEDLESSLAPVWAAADGPAGLDAWAFHLADYHPRILAVSRAMHDLWRTDPETARHRKRVRAAKLATLRRLTQRLHDEGVLAGEWTVETAAHMLDALATNDVIEVLTVDRRWSQRDLGGCLAAVFRSTFLTSKAQRRHPRGEARSEVSAVTPKP